MLIISRRVLKDRESVFCPEVKHKNCSMEERMKFGTKVH